MCNFYLFIKDLLCHDATLAIIDLFVQYATKVEYHTDSVVVFKEVFEGTFLIVVLNIVMFSFIKDIDF